MHLVTAPLLITLTMSVTAERQCGGSFCVPDIVVDTCKEEGKPCANLYFLDENGEELFIHQGTNDTIVPEKFPYGVKGVAKVQTVGTYGCYIIYKQTTAKRKEKGTKGKYCWSGNDKMTIGKSNPDYPWTVIRSVEYDPGCRCPQSQAGIPGWAIGVSVLVILLVAVVIFVIYRKKRLEAVPTNDGA